MSDDKRKRGRPRREDKPEYVPVSHRRQQEKDKGAHRDIIFGDYPDEMI